MSPLIGLGLSKRWLLAYDGTDFYVRDILCVTHDGTTGEVRYDGIPRKRLTPTQRAQLENYLRGTHVSPRTRRARKP